MALYIGASAQCLRATRKTIAVHQKKSRDPKADHLSYGLDYSPCSSTLLLIPRLKKHLRPVLQYYTICET